MNQAGTSHLLSADEEIRLGTLVQAGLAEGATERDKKRGQRAKDKFVRCNLRLVATLLGKYKGRIQGSAGLQEEDLLQEGFLGLSRAVDKFDPTKGYKFSTYAYWWIRQAMTRVILTSTNVIRKPATADEITRRWRYRPDNQTIEDFCDEWGYKIARVLTELEHEERASVSSLDFIANNQEGSACGELIADTENVCDTSDMVYEQAIVELQNIPEIADALALIQLQEEAGNLKDLALLLDCSMNQVKKKLDNARAVVREMAPQWVRETVCIPEPVIKVEPAPSMRPLVLKKPEPVMQPKPVRILVPAGGHQPESLPIMSGFAPTSNNHEELEQLIEEVKSVPVAVAPKQPSKPAIVSDSLVMEMPGGVRVTGKASGLAELINALNG